MQDNVFIDSNLWIYLFSKNEKHKTKKLITKNLITKLNDINISNQVLNEVSNVLYKKHKILINTVKSYIDHIIQSTNIYIIKVSDTKGALDLVDKYSISFYDALIVSSALSTNCNILYSEDMHHNQLIDNKLRIVNPFIEL